MPIMLLLADNSSVLRRAIRRLLEAQPEIELVGEAADFAQAIHMTNDLTPDVIVMDLHLPNKNSIDPMSVKSLLNHGSRILATSLWNDEDAQALAQMLGAVSLLDKAELGSTLIPAIMQLGVRRSVNQEALFDAGLLDARNDNHPGCLRPTSVDNKVPAN